MTEKNLTVRLPEEKMKKLVQMTAQEMLSDPSTRITPAIVARKVLCEALASIPMRGNPFNVSPFTPTRGRTG